MVKVLETGNHLVALAARSARVEVVSAYPITPQTQVIEKIADLATSGEMDVEYIPVESEHSACAALIAASITGARAFSATSAHGLAYMHEMLHYAAGLRVPPVMVNVNRAIGPGWNIWCDHQDSISQRDTGWMQVYVSSHQEVVDTLIQAYRITEDPSVSLPLMLNMDAFVLSHTYMGVEVPEVEEVDRFLPPYKPIWKLDTRIPATHGSVVYPDDFSETRQSMHEGQQNAKGVIRKVASDYRDVFGRWHGDLVDEYMVEDADHLIIAMGSIAAEARVAVDELRNAGYRAGLLRVRFLRPFPVEEIRKACLGCKDLLVIDRDCSYGIGGVLFNETKAAIYGHVDMPAWGIIVGLGGRDVTFKLIARSAMDAWDRKLPEESWRDSHVTDAHKVTREMLERFKREVS
ncbi:MAG: transketolase C-terminal domain-containing protein [Actinomycetota bacterium]|nr:transketolase C-terminal domain-containing protein [Actinomycetota bacterium]